MKNKIFFCIFTTIWILLFIFNLIIPKKTFSEEENRMLTKWPSFTWYTLLNGEYAKQAEEYINDHFIFRKEWVIAKTFFERALGKSQINGVYIGKDGYLFEKIDYNEENISKAVENINTFARKIGDTNIFHDSAKLYLYKQRKTTNLCTNNRPRNKNKRAI